MIGNEFSQKKIKKNNCTYNTITYTHLHVTSQMKKKVNVKATRTHNESN